MIWRSSSSLLEKMTTSRAQLHRTDTILFVRNLFPARDDVLVWMVVPVLNLCVLSQRQCAGNNLRYDDVKSYWRHLLVEYTKRLDWDVVKHPSTHLITADKHRVVDKN